MSSTTFSIAQRIELLEKQVALLLAGETKTADTPVEKKSKTTRTRTKTADSHVEEKPKTGRTSGYLLYSAYMRDSVKTKLTTDGAKLKNIDIMTELGAMWKALSEDERTFWNAKARASSEQVVEEATSSSSTKVSNLGRGHKTKHIKKSHRKRTRARRH
jgi:hypothetical protein